MWLTTLDYEYTAATEYKTFHHNPWNPVILQTESTFLMFLFSLMTPEWFRKVVASLELDKSKYTRTRSDLPGFGLLNLSGMSENSIPGQRPTQPVKKAEAQNLEVTTS